MAKPSPTLLLIPTFLPFVTLFACIIMHWPLPTFLVNFTTLEPARYIIFMEHTKENVLGSVVFTAILFFIGMAILTKLVHKQSSAESTATKPISKALS